MLPFHRRHVNLTRRGDPFETIRQEIDRLFEVYPFTELGVSTMKIDVSEDKRGITVRAELPGVKEEDLSVTLNDGLLTIQGEKKADTEEKDENYYMMERSFGSYMRSIRLPYDTSAENIDAEFNNGVLTVKIPKPEQVHTKGKKIKVSSKK